MGMGWWMKIRRCGVMGRWGTRQGVPRESLGGVSEVVGKSRGEFGL
jgi:hypothetical protein